MEELELEREYSALISPDNLFYNYTEGDILEWVKIGEGESGHRNNVILALKEFEKCEMFEFCAIIRDYLKTI